MLQAKIIGIGAAGNKAAIKLIESGIVEPTDVLLLNSTLKDVPAAYRELAFEFDNSSKGCAKERNLASKMAIESLQKGDISLDAFLSPEDKMVIIVNSSEGGTGCGASSIIAKYFKEVLEANVHMFVFTGFEEDARGLKNTVEYFRDLSPKYTVEAISNKKFLPICGGNKIKAEKFANDEFAKRISILLGKSIVESDNNIDDADLLKLTTTPGFMTIEYGTLEKIKNVEAFNKAVTEIIDSSKSFDIEPTCTRFGVVLNVHEKTKDSIDYLFSVIKAKFGTPFDSFFHLQDVHEDEYIQIIAAGMKMPTADIQAVYDEFVERMNKVDKTKDQFFGMSFNTAADEFDMSDRNTSADKIQANKANFFGTLNGTVIPTKNGTFQNVSTKIADEM